MGAYNSMKVLVTGGAGYIGSHTCLKLLADGHNVSVIDNFSNSSPVALKRVQELAGSSLRIVEGDVRRLSDLARAFEEPIDAVIHFAALKSVEESCKNPVRYFDNNIGGTIELLKAMDSAGVGGLVFSSSATVYGQPAVLPVDEDYALRVTNPYGRTKQVMEELIEDWCRVGPQKKSALLLRYFNPVGAHPSGQIGEDPRGGASNLMPILCEAATGRRPYIEVYGCDYPTRDGTGVRDYVHVNDLAEAHLKAVRALPLHPGCTAINLGAGRGHTVLELIRAFEKASGHALSIRFADRRPGDAAEVWADIKKAERMLDWRPESDLNRMCEDTWRWQEKNPMGYSSAES